METKPKTRIGIVVALFLYIWIYLSSFFKRRQQTLETVERGSRRLRSSSKSLPQQSLARRPLAFRDRHRKVLVLDLDETLIHTMTRAPRRGAHLATVEVALGPQLTCLYRVAKRPHCDYFLSLVQQWFEVVVFTASIQSYADPMIDFVEQGTRYFSRRLYRDSCTQTEGGYVKDLSRLGEDMGRIVLVDNSPVSYTLQKHNGLEIEGWISDPNDIGLLHLLPLLNALRHTTDVRSILCLQHGQAVLDP